MSKGLIGVLAVAGLAVGAALLLFFGYIGFTNEANRFEISIKAKYTNNQNVYDNGYKKVVEIAQVPAMQTEALKDLYAAAIKSRYGDNGAKAMLLAIKEMNPTLDQSSFLKIQQTIEAFRNEFQSNQTGLVSIKQTYETFLGATTSGRFYNMLGGYPRIDLSIYDIVTSEKTEQDFKTKKAEPLNIKGSK